MELVVTYLVWLEKYGRFLKNDVMLQPNIWLIAAFKEHNFACVFAGEKVMACSTVEASPCVSQWVTECSNWSGQRGQNAADVF